ncbi:MAG: PqiC family protein, partial [Halomonas sp.]
REETLRLTLEVDRFQGRHDGLAVIGGRWRLEAADGTLLAMDGLRAEVALAADGYPALVRALGQGWDAVADDLAEAIRQAQRQQ